MNLSPTIETAGYSPVSLSGRFKTAGPQQQLLRVFL